MSVKYKDENGVLQNGAGLYTVTKPIGMADIYSTEEKEVGLWVDNKPLYQKCVKLSALPSTPATMVSYPHNISNIDNLCDVEGIVTFSNGSISKTDRLALGDQGTVNVNAVGCMSANVDKTNINIVVGLDRSTASAVFILRYTKTTDTPWSGKFVPQGYGYVSSGDIYSFEERQVGVFTDGKPLYQKTLYFDGTVPKNTWTDHNISDVDKIWVYDAFGKRSSDYRYNGINYFGSDDYMAMAINRTQIYIAYPTQTVMTNDYITVRYTKTTDVAGSGEYVPSGDKAEHYGTDEEVIGTFLGETLYRKVFNFSTPLVVSAQQWATTDIPTSSLNVETLVNSVCICDSAIYPCAVSCDTNDTYVSILSVRTVTVTVKTLIIEYTKIS